MGKVLTLRERKRIRAEKIRGGVDQLRNELAAYGRAQGGRFLIYGSVATGNLHFESDVDILVDFGAQGTAPAIAFVEKTCAALGLTADVQPKAWCEPAFLEKISATALVLPREMRAGWRLTPTSRQLSAISTDGGLVSQGRFRTVGPRGIPGLDGANARAPVRSHVIGRRIAAHPRDAL